MKLYDFDFGLIQLQNSLNFSDSVQPIQLPDIDDIIADNTTCMVSGWGNTELFKQGGIQLQAIQIPILNQEKCFDAYKGLRKITSRMVCAGYYDEGGKDSKFK